MPSGLRATLCACTNLRRANRAVCRLYDQVLSPTGLKSTQFMMLQVIAESGQVAHCDLAAEFALSMETLSRRLASAREDGLLHMSLGERGKRIYSLTPKGRAVLSDAWPHWERAQMRMHQALGDLDWSELPRFTDRIAIAAATAESLPIRNTVQSAEVVSGRFLQDISRQ